MLKNLSAKLSHPDQERPFLEHLEALRKTLIQCALSVVVASVVCIPLANPLIHWLQAPLVRTSSLKGYAYELTTTTPVEGFIQVVKAVFAGGLLLSLPLLVYFITLFILPGLKPVEKKFLVWGGIAGGVLFFGGVLFCYYVSLPVAINIMLYFNEYLGASAYWRIDRYLGFVMHLLIGFGLALELPLILLMLGRMGLVTSSQLCRYRRHTFIGILVLAMLLTPPDIITQLQMTIPLYVLYECCIFVLYLWGRSSKRMKGQVNP